MRALVVYESMFGNTQAVADAVADGLGAHVPADAVEVGAAPTVLGEDVALLVVGGPTHAFGMSRQATRRDAGEQADHGLVSAGIGLREWLTAVDRGSGRVAAAFDTRIQRPRLPGSAAVAAEKRLRRLGFRIIAPAKSFYVTGTKGPLVDGELERARRWGDQVGATVLVTA
jgi:hypothetical protein